MIDRDTVVRLAKEAGLAISIDGGDTYFVGYQAERFATLIANETLERAADYADEHAEHTGCFIGAGIRALKDKP